MQPFIYIKIVLAGQRKGLPKLTKKLEINDFRLFCFMGFFLNLCVTVLIKRSKNLFVKLNYILNLYPNFLHLQL